MLHKSVLAKIHIAKKELKLSDMIYRDILRINSGKESAKDLTPGEADKVLEHFKDLGWKIKSPQPPLAKGERTSCPSRRSRAGMGKKYDNLGKRHGMASPAQLRLIEVTWVNNKHVRNKSAQALRKFIEHRFGISGLQFIEDRDVGKMLTAIKSIKSKTI